MPDGTTTAIGGTHDRQNRIDVNTATALALITTILFFALIFIIILHGIGPEAERAANGPTPSRDPFSPSLASWQPAGPR
jgi:hypothetical protein